MILLAGHAIGSAEASSDGDTAWFKTARKQCRRGDQAVCVDLAQAYVDGRGISPDLERASALFLEACESGQPAGCLHYGLLLLDGQLGGAPDPKAAASWFERACQENQAAGCSQQGLLYLTGIGVPRDPAP